MKIAEQWEVLNESRKTLPVDVFALPKKLGIELNLACLGNTVSGMIEKSGEAFTLTVNEQDPETRQRFTIAHELGHYMLHRHLIGDGLDDDRVYRSTDVGKYHNTRVGLKQEREANRFAANLLMPREAANDHYKKGASIESIAEEFGVSKHTMSIRLGLKHTVKTALTRPV